MKEIFYNKKIVKIKIFSKLIFFFLISGTLIPFSSFAIENSLKFFQMNPQFFILQGKVQYVYDGDTFFVSIPDFSSHQKIRIKGIDCFEIPNKYSNVRAQKQAVTFHLSLEEVLEKGEKARKLLIDLFQKNKEQVTLIVNKKNSYDIYHRLLAFVYLDNVNINQQMMDSGTCFKYQQLK